MGKLLTRLSTYLRHVFGRCQHEWKFENMVRLNEFSEEEDHEDHIVSAREYSMQRCGLCKKVKYRKL